MNSPADYSLPQVDRSFTLEPDISLCQTDLPLDWYQEEFKPYAEEFLELPDRSPETVLGYLDKYVIPAQAHFGDALLLLAHFYMGGEIVKLVEHYGGSVADSYKLALMARQSPEKKVIVESAVHFMAEAIAILANDDQKVWITNPKVDAVEPAADQLIERYGDDLTVVAYMNTSGRLKAIAGRTGGAVCTSSNAALVTEWALNQGKRVLFLPDQHLGRYAAHALGVDPGEVITLPDSRLGPIRIDDDAFDGGLDSLDKSKVILWASFCGVHTVFKPEMVEYWRERGRRVLVHPESPLETVLVADGAGSTAYLWSEIMNAPEGAKFAIGTEGHFVRNAREQGALRGVDVVHLAEIPGVPAAGCGCATMSRNDPPHLAGMVDLLRKGEAPDINNVLPGDTVDETTMVRDRLRLSERAELVVEARRALERMIEIVNASEAD